MVGAIHSQHKWTILNTPYSPYSSVPSIIPIHNNNMRFAHILFPRYDTYLCTKDTCPASESTCELQS